MVNLNISQLRLNISEFISRVVYSGERFAIKRNGKPACAIVSIEDLKLLEMLEDKLDLETAKKALQRNDSVSWEKAKKELGL
jgi:prevent-host-death family protein